MNHLSARSTPKSGIACPQDEAIGGGAIFLTAREVLRRHSPWPKEDFDYASPKIKLPAEVGLARIPRPITNRKPIPAKLVVRPTPSRYVLQKKQLFRVRGEPLFILAPSV